MPEGRIILKSISESKKLSLLKSDGARLLYTWLIPHVDIRGCYFGDPVVINGKILTRLGKTADEVDEYLNDMQRVGLIQRYEHNGEQYIQIPDFVSKQPYLNPNREAKPKIPTPDEIGIAPDQLKSNSRPTPDQLQTNSGLTPTQIKIESKVQSKRATTVVNDSKAEPADTPLPVDNSKPQEPTKAKTDHNRNGSRWTDEQGDRLDELLKEIHQRYGGAYHQQCYVFVQTHFNKGNPGAILHCLTSLITQRLAGKAVNSPRSWLEKAFADQDGKHNAREEEIKTAALKSAPINLGQMLGQIGKPMQ